MRAIISTENKAKIKAIEDVITTVWPGIQIIGEKFPSNVSEQPLSEAEGIEGALNRAQNSKIKYADADIYIGMEGYVDTNKYGMFLAGAVAIIDRNGKTGIGISGKMLMPQFMQDRIQAGEELGPLVQELLQDSAIRQHEGTNGILSKGLYTRVDEFKDATKCALARFRSSELYER